MRIDDCSCGRFLPDGEMFDPEKHCRACTFKHRTLKHQNSIPLITCPHEGPIVQWANCNCEAKHVRQCLHPDAEHDLCTRGPNSGKDTNVVSCEGCQLRPSGFMAKEVRNTFGPVGFMWCHYGDLGDVVASLRTVWQMCEKHDRSAEYYLYPIRGTREIMTKERAALLVPLLESQPYITKCEWRDQPYGVRLETAIRKFGKPKSLLADHYPHWLNEEVPHPTQPWLTVDAKKVAPIVINRTARYNAPSFPWAKIVQQLGDQAIFVGHANEHQQFSRAFGPIKYYPTSDLLEVAEVIAGCELFIGNQSCAANIAEGLKQAMVLEEDPTIPDLHIVRPNAWHGSNRGFWCEALERFKDARNKQVDHAPDARQPVRYEILRGPGN